MSSRLSSILLCLMLAFPPRSATAADESQPGAIVGLVTDAGKQPVAHATVTAVKAGGAAIRATISGVDGVYSLADLPPGTWSVTIQVDG